MIELVKDQLFKLSGIEIDIFTLEKEGIDKVLEKYNLSLNAIHVEKAKLIYRSTARYMSLKSAKDQTKENIDVAKI